MPLDHAPASFGAGLAHMEGAPLKASKPRRRKQRLKRNRHGAFHNCCGETVRGRAIKSVDDIAPLSADVLKNMWAQGVLTNRRLGR